MEHINPDNFVFIAHFDAQQREVMAAAMFKICKKYSDYNKEIEFNDFVSTAILGVLEGYQSKGKTYNVEVAKGWMSSSIRFNLLHSKLNAACLTDKTKKLAYTKSIDILGAPALFNQMDTESSSLGIDSASVDVDYVLALDDMEAILGECDFKIFLLMVEGYTKEHIYAEIGEDTGCKSRSAFYRRTDFIVQQASAYFEDYGSQRA